VRGGDDVIGFGELEEGVVEPDLDPGEVEGVVAQLDGLAAQVVGDAVAVVVMAPFYLSSCRSFNVTDHPEATTESEGRPILFGRDWPYFNQRKWPITVIDGAPLSAP
jgi:hypothetical protein